jgi:hypothetical protein
MSKFNIGEVVQVECWRGFGSGGQGVVQEIKTLYDENTGTPYDVVRVGDSWYDGTTGDSHKQKTMYYIHKIPN